MLCLRETTFLLEEKMFLWQLERDADLNTVGL